MEIEAHILAPHKGQRSYSRFCTRDPKSTRDHPLQFCSIDSTSSVAVVAGLHCSFYDSLASSFPISQHNQNNANQQLGLPGVQMNVKGNSFQNNLGVNVFNSGNSNNHYHHPHHLSASSNSLMVSQNYSTNAYHPNLTA